jgi:hypothetical protein
MSSFASPGVLVRAGFFAAAGAIAVTGGALKLAAGARGGDLDFVFGPAVVAVIMFMFAVYLAIAWRRATAMRRSLVPAMLSPGGAPGAHVLIQFRVSPQDKAELAALQPKLGSPARHLAVGVLVISAATVFTFGFALTPVVVWIHAAALAAALVILAAFGRRMRFDARTVGDGTEVVVARDAVLVAGRFHWLRDPNEPLIQARVVNTPGGPHLRLLLAVMGRFGPTLAPIWIPVQEGRTAEAKRAAREISAAIPPRLAAQAPAPD